MLSDASPQDFIHQVLGTSTTSVILSLSLIIIVTSLTVHFVIGPIFRAIFYYRNYRRLKERPMVFLEVTPPITTAKTPLATTQFYSALHGLLAASTRMDHLLDRRGVMALELVASKNDGIRFIFQLTPADVIQFEHLLASYLPSVRFREVPDYMPAATSNHEAEIIELKQAGSFAYALNRHTDIDQHDPIAYITGSMTKALENELIAYQLVISTASRRKADHIRAMLLHGKDPGMGSSFWRFLQQVPFNILKIAVRVLTSILQMVSDEITGFRPTYTPTGYAPLEISPITQHKLDAVHAKLDQPLFNVSIRAIAAGEGNGHRLQGLINALYPFHVPGYQGLIARKDFPRRYVLPSRMNAFRQRLPTILEANACVLSADELAALYHFPYRARNMEDVVRVRSRTLPAPLNLKSNPYFDIVVGVNKHHGTETPIGLTAAERERHMFIVGGTGSGKTTMLKYQIVQDIRNGKGVAVIDPHGDLAEELLEFIPEERKKDLIYLNPDDLDHPIGVNLLELPEGLKGNDLLREKDRITESVVSVMRKIFSENDSGGHRIEYVLRNTVQTALTLKGPTLFTIFRLLNDSKFASDAVKHLDDENLKLFWKDELGKAGSMQKVKMAAGITAKVGRFLFSASARAMLGQEKSTIDFSEILDGKILICNFSKGRLGEDTSMLFGITILAKLQLAALKRSERKQTDRKPFYLYVDEFQNFATMSFTQMLSEARKYKFFLTMAEQSTQQQDDQKMVNIILANVGTVAVFRTGSPKDEELLLPLLEPYIEKGEISSLPAYNFYIRIQSIESSEPTSGETLITYD